MGTTPVPERNRMKPSGAVDVETGTVYLYLNNGSPTDVELVLAHEFVHIIQRQQGVLGSTEQNETDNSVPESIVEGAAEYVQTTYAKSYLDVDRTPYEELATAYRTASPAWKHHLGPYYFGTRYIKHRIDTPRHLSRVYATPPRTAEQLLHPETATNESPTPLAVNVTTRGSPWVQYGRRTKGELFVRTALTGALNESAAARAAAGWGNDTLISFLDPSQTMADESSERGYVWALRWDSTGNASQFETAFTRYLNRRGRRANNVWRDDSVTFRVRRVGPRTVVVVVGHPEFVTNVTTTASGGAVTVTVKE